MSEFAKLTVLALSAVLVGCATTASKSPTVEVPDSSSPRLDASSATVTSMDDVTWEDLNPARGDQSPRAGTLWGDRKGPAATGYLLKPVDGFRSPPHIHNVSYRAVVIRGLLHNDDAAAEEMWMPAGSFWTQPKGAPHITSAKGPDTLAYIEIDEGPYLVHPVNHAFDTPERPVNIHTVNVVWVPSDGTSRAVEVSYLWGQPHKGKLHGVFVKLQAGINAVLKHDGQELHAVVIKGNPALEVAGSSEEAKLSPGTHFTSSGEVVHPIGCLTEDDCVLYVRASGALKVSER